MLWDAGGIAGLPDRETVEAADTVTAGVPAGVGVTPGVRVCVRPAKAPVADAVDAAVPVRVDVGENEMDTVTAPVLDCD